MKQMDIKGPRKNAGCWATLVGLKIATTPDAEVHHGTNFGCAVATVAAGEAALVLSSHTR